MRIKIKYRPKLWDPVCKLEKSVMCTVKCTSGYANRVGANLLSLWNMVTSI